MKNPGTENTEAGQTETAAKATFQTVHLNVPITRGEQTIDSLTVRKPKAGELRGLNLQELISCDISAIMKVLPRITEPSLLDSEVNDLDPADLAELGGTVRGFFMTKAERTMMEQMMEE